MTNLLALNLEILTCFQANSGETALIVSVQTHKSAKRRGK
jgi:hypothetical protein